MGMDNPTAQMVYHGPTKYTPLQQYKRAFNIMTFKRDGRWWANRQVRCIKIAIHAGTATEIKALNQLAQIADIPTFRQWINNKKENS